MFDSVVGWSDPPISAEVYRRSRSSGSVLKPVSGLYLVDDRAERAVAAHRCDSVAGHVVDDTVSDPGSVFVLSVDAVASTYAALSETTILRVCTSDICACSAIA
jgi:hypothetical protein